MQPSSVESSFKLRNAASAEICGKCYYHELARDLRQFGYEIENKSRGDFEIKGVSRELQSRFSKRHNEIDASIRKMLKGRPEWRRAI